MRWLLLPFRFEACASNRLENEPLSHRFAVPAPLGKGRPWGADAVACIARPRVGASEAERGRAMLAPTNRQKRRVKSEEAGNLSVFCFAKDSSPWEGEPIKNPGFPLRKTGEEKFTEGP